MSAANKEIINWLKNKNQRFRENICAPIVFKLMDLIGFQRHLPFTCTGDEAQELIYRKLISGKPCMIGRIGASEIRNMEGVLHQNDPFLKKLKQRCLLHQAGISKTTRKVMSPLVEEYNNLFAEKFTQRMMEELRQLDVFASWRWEETGVFSKPYHFDIVSLWDLEPFFFSNPLDQSIGGQESSGRSAFYQNCGKPVQVPHQTLQQSRHTAGI